MSRALSKRVSTGVVGALPKLPVTPILQQMSSSAMAIPTPSGNSRRLSELPPQQQQQRASIAPSPSSPYESEHIQVCVRIRPGASASDRSMYQWSVGNEQTQLQLTDPSAASAAASYRFNRIFDVASSTQNIYDVCVQRNIAAFCEGFNGTIFCYGQTASGKTHTMTGTESSPGLTLLAIDQIFSTMASDPSRIYMLKCSYVEIYNEELNDLLASRSQKQESASNSNSGGRNLPMREVGGAFRVVGLTETIVSSKAEVLQCIERGNNNRKVGVSNLNEHSSRSHSIFRLTLESALKHEPATAANGSTPAGARPAGAGRKSAAGAVRVSELSLVDLAGSETLSYEHGNSQQKETKAINLSLTNLKSVITALSKQENFIPFRNSALTKLLRCGLGGNSKTLLVCTMNPLDLHIKVSKSTLQFGQMAQSVTNEARVNEVQEGDDNANDVMLAQYRAKITGLESRMAEYARIEEEKARIQREYIELQRHLSELQRREAERARIQDEMSEASRMVVGGADAAAAAAAAAAAQAPASGVSEAEMAALSSQLSALQSQKDELQQAKLALEARLAEQQRVQRDTEAAIAAAQQSLEESATRSENEQQRLQELERLLREKSAEEAARNEHDALLQEQLAQAQRDADAKQAQSDRLAAQLAAQKRLSEEKAAHSDALTRQLEEQKRISDEKLAHAAALQAQLDAAAADMAAKEAALASMQRQQSLASQVYMAQMRELEKARAAHDAQEADMARQKREHDDRAAALQRALAAATEQNAQASSAAAERWRNQMRLMSESGMDKDSYLAQLIDRYESEIDTLTRKKEEAESVALVQQLQHTDQLEQIKRAHDRKINELAANGAIAVTNGAAPANSAAAAGGVATARPRNSGSVYPQPPASSSSSSSSSSSASSSSSSSQPGLVIPGVIDLAESDELLSCPVQTALPLCGACGSRDRIRAEKLRSLANHAARTLAHFHAANATQEKQIKELRSTVDLYNMQLQEYAHRSQ